MQICAYFPFQLTNHNSVIACSIKCEKCEMAINETLNPIYSSLHVEVHLGKILRVMFPLMHPSDTVCEYV